MRVRCHKEHGKEQGCMFKDSGASETGVKSILLRNGVTDKAKIQLKAKGIFAPLPGAVSSSRYFDQQTTVVVQLVGGHGRCWAATYASAKKNQNDRFRAKFP